MANVFDTEHLYNQALNDYQTVQKLEEQARKMQEHIDNGSWKPKNERFLSFYPYELVGARIRDIVRGFAKANHIRGSAWESNIAEAAKMIISYYYAECQLGNFRKTECGNIVS